MLINLLARRILAPVYFPLIVRGFLSRDSYQGSKLLFILLIIGTIYSKAKEILFAFQGAIINKDRYLFFFEMDAGFN